MGKKIFAEQGIRLEPKSERFGKALFRRFPAWRQYATYFEWENSDELVYFLKVTIPSANPTVVEPLIISTWPAIITVEWAQSVMEWYLPGVPDQETRVVTFLNDVVDEKYIFGYVQNGGGKIKHPHHYPASDEPDSFEVTPDYRFPDRSVLQPGDVLIERSWRGTYDKRIAGGR
jgi:hypothetical protein